MISRLRIPRSFRGVVGWVVCVLALCVPVARATGRTAHLRADSVGRPGVGYDISYPQCGSALPSGQAFGVVGVNGGLANDANGCFGSELSWAAESPGLRSPVQPAVSLYIDTADPGPTRGVTDWPRSGSVRAYGRCHGGWSEACADIYGRLRASYSYGLVSVLYPAVAGHAPWWLDVETSSSWATIKRPNHWALNLAAIRGFIAGLRAAGATAPIGIYSFTRQWTEITGLSATTTAAAFGGSPPRDWVGGRGARTAAQRRCDSSGFTGARPILAQYGSNGFDADLRCAPRRRSG